MADRRKLQGEIERCLKKVHEGVETFDDTWEKVKIHNATNTNQKEKYEADLKKEIKKLQRLRDQIKTWLASSDIKDKRILLETRKLIEMKMEMFKIVERETKTKAYSKEGLGAIQKLDPAQKEKEEITVWLASSIEVLNIQLDQFECEIESLSVSLKKKKSDKEKIDRTEELKGWLEKHRYHIKQLETLMRMLDNSTVDVDQIKKIKDDVEYYIESSQEPDFEENEFLYDDLELEDLQEFLTNKRSASDDESSIRSTTPTSTNSSSPVPSPGFTNHSSPKFNDDSFITTIKPVAIRSQSTGSITAQSNKCLASSVLRNNSDSCESSISSSPPLNHNSHFMVLPMPPSTPYAVAAASLPNNSSEKACSFVEQSKSVMDCNDSALLNSLPPSENHTATSSPCTNAFAIANPDQTSAVLLNDCTSQDPLLHHSSSTSSSVSSSSSNAQLCITSVENAIKLPLTSNAASLSCSATSTATTFSGTPNSATYSFASQNCTVSPGVIRSNVTQNCLFLNGPTSPKASHQFYNLSISIGSDDALSSSLKTLSEQAALNSGLENHISPSPALERGRIPVSEIPTLLAISPLGPVQLMKENFQQLQFLEASQRHMPLPSDSEKIRYLLRNPYPTPAYYPQGLPYCDTVEFFQRQSTETLFFVFYYMEGTKAQYLAAKALKKQSWRFHTRYMMWFQRHEEPQQITDEFEQGTYIYFDYEKWGQRKKQDFTFEYCYLEDHDLN